MIGWKIKESFRVLYFVAVFLFVLFWFFSGWPPIGINHLSSPKAQEDTSTDITAKQDISTDLTASQLDQSLFVSPLIAGIDQTGVGQNGTGTTSVTSTISTGGTNRVLVATVSYNPSGNNIATVSGAGLTWTRARSISNSTNAVSIEVWTATSSVQLSSQKITASFGSTTERATLVLSAYSGADLNSPVGSLCSATGTAVGTNAISCSLTTQRDQSLVIGNVARQRNIVSWLSAGTNYTLNAAPTSTTSGTTNNNVTGAQERASAVTSPTSSVTTSFTDSTTTGRGWAVIGLELKTPLTTLGNGTNLPNVTIGPGAVATTSDAFTLQTSFGTDSITAVTTTLAGAGNYAGIAKVEIVDSASTTVYGSITNPSTNSFSIPLSPSITASTTLQNFIIRITPLSPTAMPPPPGANYIVTSTITGLTNSNPESLGNTTARTVTIDGLSPSDVTNATGTASSGQVSLSWNNPSNPDFATTTILRATSTIGQIPTEGTVYSVNNTISTSTVACVVATPGSSCIDTNVVNGTAYYYKIFTADVYANYSTPGVSVGSLTPAGSTVSCATNISGTNFGTLSTGSVNTSSPNASTTMTCSGALGCTLYVQDVGNGSSPGLATTSPAYLIPSADATLSAGNQGYGIQATTTASGSGAALAINSKYNKTGNNVGGFTTSTTVLASSTSPVTNREVVVTHEATISTNTQAGKYADSITYSCSGN